MLGKNGQPRNNGESEQLMLWSEKDDARFQRPSTHSLPKGGSAFCETDGVCKAWRLSESAAVQDELPLPWVNGRKGYS